MTTKLYPGADENCPSIDDVMSIRASVHVDDGVYYGEERGTMEQAMETAAAKALTVVGINSVKTVHGIVEDITNNLKEFCDTFVSTNKVSWRRAGKAAAYYIFMVDVQRCLGPNASSTAMDELWRSMTDEKKLIYKDVAARVRMAIEKMGDKTAAKTFVQSKKLRPNIFHFEKDAKCCLISKADSEAGLVSGNPWISAPSSEDVKSAHREAILRYGDDCTLEDELDLLDCMFPHLYV